MFYDDDEDVFEPTPDDWEFVRRVDDYDDDQGDEPEPDDADLDERAAIAAFMDAYERGLVR